MSIIGFLPLCRALPTVSTRACEKPISAHTLVWTLVPVEVSGQRVSQQATVALFHTGERTVEGGQRPSSGRRHVPGKSWRSRARHLNMESSTHPLDHQELPPCIFEMLLEHWSGQMGVESTHRDPMACERQSGVWNSHRQNPGGKHFLDRVWRTMSIPRDYPADLGYVEEGDCQGQFFGSSLESQHTSVGSCLFF